MQTTGLLSLMLPKRPLSADDLVVALQRDDEGLTRRPAGRHWSEGSRRLAAERSGAEGYIEAGPLPGTGGRWSAGGA